MKKSRKYILFVIITVFVCNAISCNKTEVSIPTQEMEDHINIKHISFAYEDTTVIVHPFIINNKKYLMVPSHWDTSHLSFSTKEHGFKLYNNDSEIGEIEIQKSQLPTFYIKTESGSMDFVNADRNHKESGYINVIGSSGNMVYEGQMSYIKGRGSSSWFNAKKPYSIKLSKPAKILNLKKQKHFNLLSQPIDITGLRNWISYNAAIRMGLPNSIHCDYANVYFNGNYAGCYLITNKVDVNKGGVNIYNLEKESEKVNGLSLKEYKQIEKKENGRIIKGWKIANNPSDISGGYLLEFDCRSWAMDNTSSGFQFQQGSILLKSPKYASLEQVNFIKNYMDSVNEALFDYSKGINEQRLNELLDIPSFVKYYLCQEVFFNIDAGACSFYMYKDSEKTPCNKIIAGPIWDMDRTFFNEDYQMPGYDLTDVIYAGAGLIQEDTEHNGFLGMLYKNKSFREAVSNLYFNSMKSIVSDLMWGQSWDSICSVIHKDIAIDNLRWHSNLSFETECIRIKQMLEKRMIFLDTIWDDRKNMELFNIFVDCSSVVTPHLFMYLKPKDSSFSEEELPKFNKNIKKPSEYEYKFSGWFIEGDTVNLQDLKIDRCIYIKAQWKEKKPTWGTRFKKKLQKCNLM